jgi:hypothetical protein
MEVDLMWHVKDWERIYEKAQSKKCTRLNWVAIPNRHDTDGYTRLIEHEHGALHYGVWVLMVEVASKCSPRGTLVASNGEAHTAESLARITRVAARVFQEAIPRFLSTEIGWLEEFAQPLPADSQHATSALSLQDRTGQDRTGQDKTRQETSADADDTILGDGQLRDWLRWWNALHKEGLVPAGVNEESPSEAVRIAWKRSQRISEVRELLAQRDALENRIRKSTFCREGWFRLEKLLGAKNRDRELIVRKLLDGGYEDSRVMSPGRTKTLPAGPGQVHPDDVGGGF